jgi:plastocyanin
LITGCGGTKKEDAARQQGATPATFRVDPASAAVITGKVVFAGKRPALKPLVMNEEAACKRLHPSPVFDPELTLNANGMLANVFVYVKSGLDTKTFEVPREPVVIQQSGCMFHPRVIGIRAGQTLVVKNTDPVSHNIHPMPKNNREWNQQQAPQAGDLEREFARPEVMIPVKCNIHSWMKAYVGVVDHPYFTTTGEQGTFQLKNLPPGDYTLAAWHEKFGEQEQQVKVAAQSSQSVEFKFTGL